MKTGNSNIREELRKFREIKRNHGLPEVNFNKTFENSKDLIRFPSSNTTIEYQQKYQKKKSPILISNELDFASTASFLSNPILNGILSPHTVSKLELLKQMDVQDEFEKKGKTQQIVQDMSYQYQDKENINTINNAIVQNQYKQISQPKSTAFVFESKKSNNRYISQEQCNNQSLNLSQSLSSDNSFITPCSNSVIDFKQANLSRSKDNSMLDHDIVSFYQNIKAHKEKQMKSQKSDSYSQINLSQCEQKMQNTQKPPKISTSPINPRKSQTERRFIRQLTPVNINNQAMNNSNTIEIKKLNLFEEDELRQQVDILLKEKSQDKQIIGSLMEDNKYLQRLSENLQQNHKSEIQNHKMQIEMLLQKIQEQESQIQHLSALNSLYNSHVSIFILSILLFLTLYILYRLTKKIMNEE